MFCPKCGHQRTPEDDPNIPDSQCPACGIFYFKYLDQKSGIPRDGIGKKTEEKEKGTHKPFTQTLFRRNTKTEPETPQPIPVNNWPNAQTTPQMQPAGGPMVSDAQRLLAHMELEKYQTNHVLHLLLSLVTVGLWLIVWLVLAADNTDKRIKIQRKYELEIESNTTGILIRIVLCMILLAIFMKACRS